MAGTRPSGVMTYDDTVAGPTPLITCKANPIMAFGGAAFSVPKTVRVTWREGENLYNYREQRYDGGVITGDYTNACIIAR